MKFILVSTKNRTAYNFRGDLVKKIIASGYEVIITGPNRDNIDKVEELGARFVEIPMNKNGVNPLKDFSYMVALWKLFKKEKNNKKKFKSLKIKFLVYEEFYKRSFKRLY